MKLHSVLVVLCALPCVAQGPFQVSLVALQPIVVWGAAGQPVVHPAEPLTSANLVGPTGTTHASFTCALTNGATSSP